MIKQQWNMTNMNRKLVLVRMTKFKVIKHITTCRGENFATSLVLMSPMHNSLKRKSCCWIEMSQNCRFLDFLHGTEPIFPVINCHIIREKKPKNVLFSTQLAISAFILIHVCNHFLILVGHFV